MSLLGYGLVARQVGMFSGCSTHSLKWIPALSSELARDFNSASLATCVQYKYGSMITSYHNVVMYTDKIKLHWIQMQFGYFLVSVPRELLCAFCQHHWSIQQHLGLLWTGEAQLWLHGMPVLQWLPPATFQPLSWDLHGDRYTAPNSCPAWLPSQTEQDPGNTDSKLTPNSTS